ncbi:MULTISPECIES: GNAT family N-acetyltransferase [unclassified Aureispira]|uniref:GNAT family N-acetyltransferase n=1 Tax=unclassified Aureispira TaxID=2649989 RepID=UPI0006967886|nr:MULTISPECIES: GNAT family N-acetyltransferase [unclassified Aureispira]WMX16016.1 GNAT family N-acetyltransferase [Aureispira sp. CCB-E]
MVEKLSIKEINKSDGSVLQEFIDSAGNSAKTFRYFDKRSIDVLDNHQLTLLAFIGSKPVGYGHLDYEDGRTWLGIAMIEGYTGKGFGKQIMNYLLNYADTHHLPEIYLSVDKDNMAAVSLYNQLNFEQVKELNNAVLIMKRLKQ